MSAPFCICGHSRWSHHVGFFDTQGNPNFLGKLREKCERIGCRCRDFQEKPA